MMEDVFLTEDPAMVTWDSEPKEEDVVGKILNSFREQIELLCKPIVDREYRGS